MERRFQFETTMKINSWGGWFAICAALGASACGADYTDPVDDDGELELGAVSEAVAACAGDDLQYDFNAFAASLAVAIANELGRWDVHADFEVRNGKLELSATGNMRCNGNCPNITALLRLQDDATSVVPNHSPSIYRSKLTSWHGKQKTSLTSLVDRMLTVDKGIFRLKGRLSGKYLAVAGGSKLDGAPIELRYSTAYAGADRWRVVLDHGRHKFINVLSGKCLAQSQDNANDNTPLVQVACSTSGLQKFGFDSIGSSYFAIRTTAYKALTAKNYSTSDGAQIVQLGWSGTDHNQQWQFESYGSAAHLSPEHVATAMYSLTAKHSNKALGVDGGSLADGAAIKQRTYSAADDRFHWYITRVGERFQFVNRRSGKCIATAYDNNTSAMVQRTCSTATNQMFSFNLNANGAHIIYSTYGAPLEVQGASLSDDASIAQGGSTWADHRRFFLTPLIAGEPHRLSYSHSTDDAACGKYYWYNIAQPNGQAVKAPGDTYVQLMFAGGKETANGADINPFIAQQVSGNLVAIDPSGYMNPGSTSSSGSCIASDLLYDVTKSTGGKCCVRYDGAAGIFRQSTWSTTTYLCSR